MLVHTPRDLCALKRLTQSCTGSARALERLLVDSAAQPACWCRGSCILHDGVI